MTVADNIGFGLRVRKRPKDQIRKRVDELLELINLPDKGGRYPVPAVGRPAAARRPGPGARDRAPGPAPRRAAVGPRREDPGRPAQGDPGDPAPARDHDGLRDPRPGGGALAVRPGRGHERGPDRADRHAVRDLQLPGDAVRGLVRRHAQPAPGTVVDGAAARLTHRRPGDPVGQAGPGARPAQPVTVALRPGGASSSARAAARTGCAATVEDVSFLGSIVRTRVRRRRRRDRSSFDTVQRPEPDRGGDRRDDHGLVPARGDARPRGPGQRRRRDRAGDRRGRVTRARLGPRSAASTRSSTGSTSSSSTRTGR